MRSILLSIKPQHVANILNGVKTIEIRKKFPKDYTGWVYIYCTKQGGKYWRRNEILYEDDILIENGKVVARFWCDKVEDIYVEEWDADYGWEHYALETKEISHDKLTKKSCLTEEELWDYLGVDLDDYYPPTVGYAIHISKLEIFDEPKELSEFGCKRAPQNYCYMEGKNNGI